MEFLLGNPFSSPVGQRIEKATDGSLQNEDWALNMEICDIINETEEGPRDAFRAVKKRIVGNKNFHEVMLALTVLETCVKNCGHRFHVLVASQDFVESVLVRTILPKNNPPTIVHDKVLTLIQSWADAFRSSPDLTGVVTVYEDLRRKGLEFPMTDLDMLSPIHTPQRTVFSSETPSGQNSVGTDTNHRGDSSQHTTPLSAPAVLPSDTPITPTPEQIGKLRSELEMVSGNVRVMSEMLTELVPTQAEPTDLELLQELDRTCRAMQQRVLELIPRIADEQLTEELLVVNDNLNNVFLRHERFERFRTGQTAKAPSEAEAAADLMDMGTDPAAPSSLSSQLAGMNLGSSSVRAGLQSLEASGRLEDEFDMFALTRGSSLADQRKEVKYEDPQATDGLAGALDARQQNTGAMGGSSEKSLSDWMVRQGMVRRGQAGHPESWGCRSQGSCPGGAVGGRGTVRPRGEGGALCMPGQPRACWAQPSVQHGPTPSALASTAPQCPLLAPDLEARPRQPLGQLRGGRGSPGSGASTSRGPSGRGSWCGRPRALAAAVAGAAGAAGKRLLLFSGLSCCPLASSAAGDRAWGLNWLGWKKTVSRSLSQSNSVVTSIS
ncbi:target of Myb1 membrane trafficking protein isoform X1 [Diceros bicornis minor]|uniref:target of Myb1 membrane trafficking protein isoform X1 n=1 Tax=Diceros bicornis minor TaxID=77932 RepID=UPI0026EA1E3A|nr:target of Myb1 membrane trafficking protein isoform X1 [Diceros bicornis minor]